jgi:hypothetical protein
MTDRYTKIVLTVMSPCQLSPLLASSRARSHKGQSWSTSLVLHRLPYRSGDAQSEALHSGIAARA